MDSLREMTVIHLSSMISQHCKTPLPARLQTKSCKSEHSEVPPTTSPLQSPRAFLLKRPQAHLLLLKTLEASIHPNKEVHQVELSNSSFPSSERCLSLVEVWFCRFKPGGFTRLSPSALCCSLTRQSLLCCSYKTLCVCVCMYVLHARLWGPEYKFHQ